MNLKIALNLTVTLVTFSKLFTQILKLTIYACLSSFHLRISGLSSARSSCTITAGTKRGCSAEFSATTYRDHVTPSLIQLHWLPVHFRVQYKSCMLMNCIHIGRTPPINAGPAAGNALPTDLRAQPNQFINLQKTTYKSISIPRHSISPNYILQRDSELETRVRNA